MNTIVDALYWLLYALLDLGQFVLSLFLLGLFILFAGRWVVRAVNRVLPAREPHPLDTPEERL